MLQCYRNKRSTNVAGIECFMLATEVIAGRFEKFLNS